jgi:hypothetical protein
LEEFLKNPNPKPSDPNNPNQPPSSSGFETISLFASWITFFAALAFI